MQHITRPKVKIKIKTQKPPWIDHVTEINNQIWLPTHDHGSFQKDNSKSWFSMQQWKYQQTDVSRKMSSPSSMFSPIETMLKENVEPIPNRTNSLRKSDKPIANICRRIRLFPDPEVKQKLKSWFGCVRKTYNLALSAIQNQKVKIDVSDLRKEFTNNSKIKEESMYPYLLETPKHVRDGAITDLVGAFKSNFTKHQINPEFKFNMNFRSKKQDQSILIEKDSGAYLDHDNHCFHLYPRFLDQPIKYYIRHRDRSKKFIPNIEYDCRLILDTKGHYYINIPCFVSTSDNQTGINKKSWGALDPGVRTFQTIYSPQQGIAYKIGSGDQSRIYRLCLALDRLISKRDQGFSQKTHQKNQPNHQSIRHKIKNLRSKIQHIVDEVHWKTIHFLLTNFRNILIPIFNVQNMICKKSRKLNVKSVRQMLGWSHYKFRQRLISNARRTQTKVWVIGEEYSTQTCGSCLCLHKKVGGQKQFKCPQCQIMLDRDLNGARNIFMMNVKYEGERRVLKRRQMVQHV